MSKGSGGNASSGFNSEAPLPSASELVLVNVECGEGNETTKLGPVKEAIQAKGAYADRGRIWTMAHHKALLTIVQDEECCFLEKQGNREKDAAWRMFSERLRNTYPSLFGAWKMDRKQVRRRIMDLLRMHRDNEQAALRATGRSGGMVDEEFVHLCEEVCERVDEAEAVQGDKRTQKIRAREDKERAGEMLRVHQMQTGGKRARAKTPSSTSPEDSTTKPSGRRRRSAGDDERVILIPALQCTLSTLMQKRAHEVACNEWNMRAGWHEKHPDAYPHPGPLDSFVSQHVSQPSSFLTSTLPVPTSRPEEGEVESPNKDLPTRSTL